MKVICCSEREQWTRLRDHLTETCGMKLTPKLAIKSQIRLHLSCWCFRGLITAALMSLNFIMEQHCYESPSDPSMFWHFSHLAGWRSSPKRLNECSSRITNITFNRSTRKKSKKVTAATYTNDANFIMCKRCSVKTTTTKNLEEVLCYRTLLRK